VSELTAVWRVVFGACSCRCHYVSGVWRTSNRSKWHWPEQCHIWLV